MLSLREEEYVKKRQSTSNEHHNEVVDVTDPPPKLPWIQNEHFTLYSCDKSNIKSGNWLTDDIINAGQKILATQFEEKFGKAGFQSVILGNTFSFNVELKELILFKCYTTVIITGSQSVQLALLHRPS